MEQKERLEKELVLVNERTKKATNAISELSNNFNEKKLEYTTQLVDYKANEKTLKEYPYHFVLNNIYKLHGSTITTEYQVISSEIEHSIPYFIGGHPGFNCPLEDNEKYEDYYLEFSERHFSILA